MDVIAENEYYKIERLELSSFATNAYIVICQKTGKSALIDVPAGAPTIIKHLKGKQLEWILLTHSHIDHIGGLKALHQRLPACLAVHPADNQKWLPVKPDYNLSQGDTLVVGKLKIKAFHTPGHTPGSMCFKLNQYLFSGDTIFPGGPGRTTDPEAFAALLRSITECIFKLPENTEIYPGHGSPSVLKKEKAEFAAFAKRPHDPGLCGDVVWLTS